MDVLNQPLEIGKKASSAIYAADSTPICIVDTMGEASTPDADVAARLVACWNACAGIPTNILDLDQSEYIILLRNREQIAKQRDQLLAALKKMVDAMIDYQMDVDCPQPPKHREMMAEARAAIAAVEQPCNPVA